MNVHFCSTSVLLFCVHPVLFVNKIEWQIESK